MAALRVVVQGGFLRLGPTGADMDYITLDCWKAQLVLCTVDAIQLLYVDGVPIMNGIIAPSGLPTQLYLKFGGMVLNNKPVNLNQRLQFSMNEVGVDQFPYFLTKTYYDPDLLDPSKR